MNEELARYLSNDAVDSVQKYMDRQVELMQRRLDDLKDAREHFKAMVVPDVKTEALVGAFSNFANNLENASRNFDLSQAMTLAGRLGARFLEKED